MPRCVPCLSTDVKSFIGQSYPGPSVAALLDSIPDCRGAEPFRLCQAKDGRKTRAPSEYNLFVRDCLKSKPIKGRGFGAAAPFMKECADAWRRRHK